MAQPRRLIVEEESPLPETPRTLVLESEESTPIAPTNPLAGRFAELERQAGPRGFTFAGRHVAPPPSPLSRLTPQFSIAASPEARTLRSPEFSILGGRESVEEILSRVPIGELEAGGLAAAGPIDLAAGLALGRGIAHGATHPREVVTGVKRILSGFSSWYEGAVDRLGHGILNRVPKVFRAGRGTPLEFREARALMESDVANGVEKALELGTPLQRHLSPAERLRADQLLRGGISVERATTDVPPTGRLRELREKFPGTPEKVSTLTAPVRAELDRLQNELLKLGRLSPETVKRFEDNFGPYFARLYSSKELTPKNPVLPWSPPVRAGTPRLKARGERIEIEIPSLEEEMESVARLLGPESEFRREFRSAAKELTKRRETVTSERVTERPLGEQRTVKTETSTIGGEGEFTEIPLSGVAQRLEKVVTDALQARGMTAGEAAAAVGRVKAAAVKAGAGQDVKLTAGGTATQKTTETVKQQILREKETVKTVIENLGVNNAQRAALHAYYDAISRAGAKAKSIKVGDKTYRIDPVMDIESGLERTAALKPLLDDGYIVEARDGSRVTLFRDIPEEVRTAPAGGTVVRGGKELTADQLETMVEQGIEPPKYVKDWQGRMWIGGEVSRGMGELRKQPGFVTAKSVAQVNREVAVNKFFNTVARNPEWTSDTAKPGFVQLGDSKKTLGELANKFVRSDVAAELNEIVRIKADWEKITTSLTQMWKVGKVFNPATISRNVMSSAMMADWGGLSPWKPSGIRSYAKTAAGFLGRDVQAQMLLGEAKQGGLFRASFNQQEIAALADGFLASRDENGIIRIIDATRQLISRAGEPLGHPTRWYGAVDHFFKGALYVHARSEMGLNPTTALRFAKKYGIDYGDISPAVRLLRDFPLGAPFATFASKAIPLTIETAVKHPVRFWKWPLGFMAISELSSAAFEDERAELEKARDLGEVPSPRFILLPEKDKDGRYQFLDLGYILPFGDILETINRLQGGSGTNIAFEIPGGPAKALLEISFNKNDFTGKPIYKNTDTFTEAAAKVSDHILKAWLPAFAPPIPGTGFRGGHSTEAFRKATIPEIQLPAEAPISPTDYAGRTRSPGTTVASKIFGLNIKSVDPQEVQYFKVKELEDQVGELSMELVRVQRSGITTEQKEAETQRITEKLQTLMENAQQRLMGQEPGPSQADIVAEQTSLMLKDKNVSLEDKIQAAIQASELGGVAGMLPRRGSSARRAPSRLVLEDIP